jgi:hypothetical protein
VQLGATTSLFGLTDLLQHLPKKEYAAILGKDLDTRIFLCNILNFDWEP